MIDCKEIFLHSCVMQNLFAARPSIVTEDDCIRMEIMFFLAFLVVDSMVIYLILLIFNVSLFLYLFR